MDLNEAMYTVYDDLVANYGYPQNPEAVFESLTQQFDEAVATAGGAHITTDELIAPYVDEDDPDYVVDAYAYIAETGWDSIIEFIRYSEF
jgi:hypothetical protein